jgi:hypothetical protein
MKTLKFSINVEAIDSYIYSGHLFLILKNGDIAFAPLSKIVGKLANVYPKYNNLIRLSFQRNDYFANNQGEMILGIPEVKNTSIDVWDRAANQMKFMLEYDSEDYKIIGSVPTMPVLDLKMYAMRLYLGTKDGLYEINLNSDDRYNLKPTKPKKRFDAKVTCLNAKCGEIIISSNSDGLFHGTFLNEKNILKVNHKQVSQKSIRTSWSGYDIINYGEQSNFDYFINKTAKVEKKPGYSKFDESIEKQRILEFGVSKFAMSDLLQSSDINYKDISYCFNSSSSGFFFMNDGRFININLNKDKDNIHFTSRNHLLPDISIGNELPQRPISGSIVPKGCVVEYYNKVVLYHNSQAKLIEDVPSINVRSYPSSLRYRNIITITKEKEISIHSIYPFNESLSKYEIVNKDILNIDDNYLPF